MLRVLATIPVMGMVALVVFLLLRLTPGDPATVLAGDFAPPETVEAIRLKLGLATPLYEQFFRWLTLLARGDLGNSIISNQPVTRLIGSRIEPTLSLSITTLLLSLIVAIPLGTLAAWKHDTWIDRTVMLVSVIGFSVPVFVLGYLLILGFSINLRWFPVQGFASLSQGAGPFFARLTLPTITLSVFYVALIARITRASMLDVLNEGYIRTARAKGVGEIGVLVRHGLRTAAAPIVSIVGIGIALLISGALLTESVFNLPGIGTLTLDAVMSRDYMVLQGVILVMSGAYIFLNLIIDVIYAALDPRIRY